MAAAQDIHREMEYNGQENVPHNGQENADQNAADGNPDNLTYSTDEAFESLTDQDPAVEILGYIDSIEGRKVIKNYVLYKFVLTNGRKKITCLMWGDELINKHQADIRIGRILCIDGAKCKAALLNYQRQGENFVPFELIIQANTVLEYLGFHEQGAPVPLVNPQNVTFEEVGRADGLICIEGFVKSIITKQPTQYRNVSYGQGSITDGTIKLNVQVNNFEPMNMVKGQPVRVTGVVNPTGSPFRVECQSMADIVLLPGRIMTRDRLLLATRNPTRIRDE